MFKSRKDKKILNIGENPLQEKEISHTFALGNQKTGTAFEHRFALLITDTPYFLRASPSDEFALENKTPGTAKISSTLKTLYV